MKPFHSGWLFCLSLFGSNLFCFIICTHFCFVSAKKIIITIDGYSSCGKSTLAKQLARELHYVFIDSGAMYRAITLYFLRNHVNYTKTSDVKKALQNINLEFERTHDGESDIYL